MKFKVTIDSRKFTFQSEELPTTKWSNFFTTLGAVPDYDRSSIIRESQIHIGFDDFDDSTLNPEVMQAQSPVQSYGAADSGAGHGGSSQLQEFEVMCGRVAVWAGKRVDVRLSYCHLYVVFPTFAKLTRLKRVKLIQYSRPNGV